METNSKAGDGRIFRIGLYAIAAAAFAILAPRAASAQEQAAEAERIVRLVDEAQSFDTRVSETLMRTYPDAEDEKEFREFRSRGYGMGLDKSLMDFVSPKAIAGLRILTIDDDTWMYFPSTGRVRKIAGKSKGSSVQGVGGDFTYEDLGGGKLSDKYSFVIVGEDAKSWTLDGKPLSADSSYERIVMTIDKGMFLPVRIEYYARKDGLLKVMTADEIKNMGGRATASAITMRNVKKGSKTVVKTLSVEYGAAVQDKLVNPTQFYK